jgi:glycosyltransferase involved in cell wall biosynthesis
MRSFLPARRFIGRDYSCRRRGLQPDTLAEAANLTAWEVHAQDSCSMRVLFASGIDGFCHRYGVLHWAEQLATQGITSTAWAHTDPRLATALATHDVLVLYRVPDAPWIRHLLARATALGRPTVFAVDDLIVVPELTDVPALRGRSDAEHRLWHDGVRRYRRTLEACDAFLATTEPIAAVGRGLGMPTHLQRCGVSSAELALGAAARAGSAAAGTVRLGYFSGTATHDDDLAAIAPVLVSLLVRHPQVELLVVGPVALPSALAPFAARLVRQPLVVWTALPDLVASCVASLVPLEWRHPFVAAKGAVKYLEAATVGVPVIASPTDAFRDAIRDGVTGWLAADLEVWQQALETVVTHPERAAHVGATARADVGLRFAPAAQGHELAAFLSTVVAGLRAPHATPPAAPALDERALGVTFPGEVAHAAREPDARPDHAAGATAVTTAPLADGTVLAQCFPSHHAGLTRVDVHTITYGLALDHTLHACVRRDDGSEVASQEIWAGGAPDRDWLAIDLPPEPDSAGRTYTLELRARGTGTRNALSFGVSADPCDPYTIDGVAGPSALALRSFAGWTAAAASMAALPA